MDVGCAGNVDLNSIYAKYKLLFECALDIVFLIDNNGKILDANHTAITTYGYTREELFSMNVKDLRIPSERASIESNWKDAFTKGAMFETVHIRKDGSTFPVEISLRGIDIDSQKLLLGLVRDITKRKELVRSLARLASIVQSSHDSIIGVTLDGTISEWNHGAERIFGYTSTEAIGRHISFLSPPERKREVNNILNKVVSGESVIGHETRRARKDGTIITVLLTASPIIDPDGKILGVSWVSRDISERKRAEDAIRRQAALIDLTPDAVVVRTLEGKIISWSRGAEFIYGYSKYEAPGQIIHNLLKTRFPEPLEKINNQMLQTGYWSGELVHTTKDSRLVIVQSRWLGQYDRLGNITEVLETNVNVTERKHAEEELNREKERVEFLIDLMGHDINNMNQIAMSNLEMALEQAKCSSDKEFIENSLNSLKNSSKLIGDVRTIQQVETHKISYYPVNVCQILSALRTDFQDIPGRKVVINLTKHCNCIVNANELLKEVFSNIIGNAIKHSTGSVTIDIIASEAFEGGQRYCKISVEDNGPGIPGELKGKLFTSFSASATKVQGKGIGLYLVKMLVEDLHGKVWVEDRVPGDHTKGARFMVLLPAI